MKDKEIKFKTRISLKKELFIDILAEVKKEKKQVNWLLAASFFILFTLNISACLTFIKKDQQSIEYLIKSEYYE